MKLSRLLTIAIIALAFGAATSFAQKGMVAPDKQLGIGFGTYGASVQYAISPSMHVGTTVALATNGGTSINLGPYFRLLLEGQVNPIIQAGLDFRSFSQSVGGVSTTVSTKSLYGAFGVEYFPIRSCGVLGMAKIIDLSLETGGGTDVGILSGAVGIEWFFN